MLIRHPKYPHKTVNFFDNLIKLYIKLEYRVSLYNNELFSQGIIGPNICVTMCLESFLPLMWYAQVHQAQSCYKKHKIGILKFE